MKKQHVLIVGGGFGGVKAALELADDDRFDVTLVSQSPNFHYYPALYRTATGGKRANAVIPFDDFFADKRLTVVIGTAQTLDRKAKALTMETGEVLPYDSLILGLGVITNYFGIPGLEEFSFGIKSIEQIQKFKAHLHRQLIDQRRPDLNYVIVGGGPTGIELAGALPKYLKQIMRAHGVRNRNVHIDLVEAAPKLLPRSPRDMSRMITKRLRQLGIHLYLGKVVQGASADSLTVSGKPIQSHTVVWTAGVTNNPFFTENKFVVMNHGKVAVDVYLQADQDIYVIGDNANTPYSGMAQTAMYDGEFVARNLRRKASGKQFRSYKAVEPWSVIPVGPHWAAASRGGFRVYGLLGWFLREAADLRAFHDYESWDEASNQWLSEFGYEEACSTCAAALAE